MIGDIGLTGKGSSKGCGIALDSLVSVPFLFFIYYYYFLIFIYYFYYYYYYYYFTGQPCLSKCLAIFLPHKYHWFIHNNFTTRRLQMFQLPAQRLLIYFLVKIINLIITLVYAIVGLAELIQQLLLIFAEKK